MKSVGEAAPQPNVAHVTGLEQNSPNPFNPVTRIRFSLETSSRVTLRVYNVRGELVETLVSGVRGPGQHRVTWDARRQPSGVYFYRMETPDFVQTRKMIILK